MGDPDRRRASDGERYPNRRLSSIGRTTSGWRSSLETGRDTGQSLGTFIVGALIAAGVFALIGFVLLNFAPRQ
jgi:hypothetical protein